MATYTILVAAGVILVAIGIIGGGIKLKELDVPKIPFFPRTLAFLIGAAFIVGGFIDKRQGENHIDEATHTSGTSTTRPPMTQGEMAATTVAKLTNDTAWNVEAYDESGVLVPGIDGMPWEFHPDGSVNAGNVWHGQWIKKSDDVVQVTIGGDVFDVQFQSDREFVARKNGRLYRRGTLR